MRELMAAASANYGIKIHRYAGYQDGYVLDTDIGKLYLKETGLSLERIRFIHGAKEHLCKNGFDNVDSYICTREGEPAMSGGDFNYTLCKAECGKESDFDSMQDVRKAAEVLGEMHSRAQGYIMPEKCFAINDLGKLCQYYSKKLRELKRLSNYARSARGKFDHLFLGNLEYYLKLGESVVEKLNGKEYRSLVEQERRSRSFCHHDYSHRNLYINNGVMKVTGFDNCRYEIRVFDLADLITKRMGRNKWNTEEAGEIISCYSGKRKLNDNEKVVIKEIIKFPYGFWKVANRFYNSRRSWAEKRYTNKLMEILEARESFDSFLRQLEQW